MMTTDLSKREGSLLPIFFFDPLFLHLHVFSATERTKFAIFR